MLRKKYKLTFLKHCILFPNSLKGNMIVTYHVLTEGKVRKIHVSNPSMSHIASEKTIQVPEESRNFLAALFILC